MHIKKIDEKGIGLIEVIAALGIAIIVITSLVSLSVYTLRSALQGRLLLQGTKLANQELEKIRTLRDVMSWAEFNTAMSSCTTPCHVLPNANLGVDRAGAINNSGPRVIDQNQPTELVIFFRASDPQNGIIDAADNIIRIQATVRWRVGAHDRYAHVYTDLSNWRGN